MNDERRHRTRQKSLLRGLVYLGNSPSAVSCLVRDVSDTGARLKFGGPVTVPDTLELHIPTKNQILRAKVKWREADEIGVSFISETGVTGAPAGDDDLAARVQRLESEIATLKQIIKKLQRTSGGNTEAA